MLVHALKTELTHAKPWRLSWLSQRAAGVDVATDPRAPRIAKVVQPEDIREKTGVTSPQKQRAQKGASLACDIQCLLWAVSWTVRNRGKFFLHTQA